MKKVIPYGRQEITSADVSTLTEVLQSDFLTQGPWVDKFEKAFAEFVSADHAIAITNATGALHLSCLALGVKKGQKIMTASNTFVASANCVRYCEGDVEFVDLDPKTLCLDLNQVEDLLKKNKPGTYSGIIPVDFAGYPVQLEELRTLTEKYGLWILEDAAHAPGAKYKTHSGQWVSSGSGQHSELSIFSFHPVKHIATGEGGMITTRNKKLADKLRLLRSHGITRNASEMQKNDGGWYYEMQQLGYNYRMPDINCALGYSQLQRIEPNLARRRQIAQTYTEKLAGLPLKTPFVSDQVQHAYHLYVIRTERRKELYDFLKTKNIYSQIHYIPVHTQPYYVELYGKKSLPETEKYYSECLSLPMFHAMTVEEQNYVIETVKEFYAR